MTEEDHAAEILLHISQALTGIDPGQRLAITSYVATILVGNNVELLREDGRQVEYLNALTAQLRKNL